MVLARWVAVPWALLQMLAYSSEPYPPGVRSIGLVFVGLLAAGNLTVQIVQSKVRTYEQARMLAIGSLSLDILVVSAIVWLFAFDPLSALWAVYFIVLLEGAIRFQLKGALGTWAATTVIYAAREVWGSDRYGYPLEWNSITFRMGIGLMIALVAGLMARDLVRQRTQLSHALQELRRIDGLRQGLVSTLAHDVRNPLTVIRGAVSTLIARGEALEWATVLQLLQSTDRQANRMQRLATDLLDLARLEQGRLDLELVPTHLSEVVQEALSFADPDGLLEVKIPHDLMVMAAPDRLEQVVVNLVTNALRYGKEPFTIQATDEDNRVCLSVSDAGPGVPPEQLQHLFEAFHSESDKTSVGFGLAIVKALTEAQRGRVDYLPGEPGAVFRVLLDPVDNR
jgi:signal transduction histidine kinase